MKMDEWRCRVRTLNDQLRRQHRGGQIFVTRGVSELGVVVVAAAMDAVARFDGFTPDNDPHGEHDFGMVTVLAQCLFWKIDYLDHKLTGAAEDPTDPAKCARIMTVMLAEEY